MEGNLSSRSGIQGNASFGGFDLQGPMRVHHHQQQQQALVPHHHVRQGSSMVHHTIHENFPLTMGSSQEEPSFSLTDYNKMDRGKSASDEDDPSFAEDAADNRGDPSKGKKASPWQRVKWTDGMVRLLITAVSYISEEAAAEYGGGGARRKYANLQKKGKWKSVSKVMAERGHFVSPQQCEDKFNDLNKRYKRLNEILGRGTSCEVVEKPALLDVMDHIPEKAKEEVRKILSSKHLHYEEMCSYHNGNRLHLPADPELQRSLRLALRSRDDHDDSDAKRHLNDDNDEDDHEAEYEDHGEFEENQALAGDRRAYLLGNPAKRAKQCQTHDEFSFRNSLNSLDCNKTFCFQVENADSDANKAPGEGSKTNAIAQKQSLSHWNLQIEEQRLNIEMQMLELEKEKFKWQRFCRKKDRELEMMRMEIERMKLENERMALDLRRKELGIDSN
ncbi:hypothetical protein SASPL_133573 [Salvia splendens]|uniref:Myb/SANT-like DNA-binding domain-containing protein n=1 Tax=Salvia splendens TaxID=180675 RepID=A0A8X8ZI61_SALSN|nr:uncharacterized protein LOC121756835 [Salvia splendens]KAG6405977.1 hypothetical protein SASPL_133573 [Salvia splendens]